MGAGLPDLEQPEGMGLGTNTHPRCAWGPCTVEATRFILAGEALGRDRGGGHARGKGRPVRQV